MDRKLGALIGLLVLIGALVAAILIGRGSGDSGDESTASGDVPKAVIAGVTEDLEAKPKLAGTGDAPPEELVTKDIVVGDGPEAKEGDTVKVQYVGALYDNGTEFDASWTGNEPGDGFEFTLGGGQVIQGWDEGVAGMKVGGRRVLVIPPDLGYGEQGSPPTIPGNATLVFVVDLEEVK
jgi:FKBP-type peptidyl-prolyl cis-trans isomerase